MNSDLISRSALKKVISEYIDEYSDLDNEGYHCEKWCAMKEAEMAIDNAPTAIAVDFGADGGDKTIYSRPTGEWVECEEWNEIYYECSVCKEPWCILDGTPVDNLMNYCPVCGAKMQGVRKKEE